MHNQDKLSIQETLKDKAKDWEIMVICLKLQAFGNLFCPPRFNLMVGKKKLPTLLILQRSCPVLREMETNNHPILRVFLSVFCVVATVT